jgi:hypothetical protein
MGSSGAAVIDLTVPARSGTDGEREPRGERCVAPLRSAGAQRVLSGVLLSAYVGCLSGACRAGQQGAQQTACSVGGRRSLDLCGPVGTQPIVVMLQMFDDTLKIANPRSQPSALQNKTIIEINPLTQ